MTMTPDPRNHAPTAQTGGPSSVGMSPAASAPRRDDDPWFALACSAFDASTTYLDANYRKKWDDSIRAFNNQHPTDSKYTQPSYEKRSRVYRPKTRSVIRKNEAAAAAAFFSNMDVVSVSAQDQSSKKELASADVMKELLQYRLTKSIPWYQTLLGGFQDAQVTGVACAHVHWEYVESGVVDAPSAPVPSAPPEPAGASNPEGEEYPQQPMLPPNAVQATESGQLREASQAPQVPLAEAPGEPKILSDKPVIDLFPVENLRIDPGANWVNPIEDSPYLIHLMPLYVLDVKARMDKGEWFPLNDAFIVAATEVRPDTTRLARNKERDDPYTSDNKSVDDYAIVWVQRHIHRKDGEDWEFYTLANLAMLTEPVLLRETVFHGKRPYVMGVANLETHKVFPTSLPELSKGLQDETNEIANQRLDNVKFVLNKKYFVKRGIDADIQGLVRNVPGGVVMMNDPQTDVREITWPDVTASAFQEQQGINMEMDELLGNFNPAALMAAGANNAPARNMTMLSQSNGTLVEYLIRTFTETFVQPVLRQLVQLEQHYETDQVILKIAGARADLVQKYGIDQVTDELLEQELTLTVNVGMGATDPMQKLNKFITAMGAYVQMASKPLPGLNLQEVGKEIFGHVGYQNGSRFFTNDNPQVAQLQGQLQEMAKVIQQLQAQAKDKSEDREVKLKIAAINNDASLKKAAMHESSENKRSIATHYRALMERDIGHRHDVTCKEREHVLAVELEKHKARKAA